jgi:hypothetical protein
MNNECDAEKDHCRVINYRSICPNEMGVPAQSRFSGGPVRPGVIPSPYHPREGDSRTFCMVMIWDSVESIVAAMGDDWKNAHVSR